MKASIIIPTLNRPDIVKRALESIFQYCGASNQIIVVDSSTDDLTKKTVTEFPGVKHIRAQVKNQAYQWNVGVINSSEDILIFLDDDSIVHKGWLENLINSYSSADIGGVGGMVVDPEQKRSEWYGTKTVGQILRSGLVINNFDTDTGETIEVDKGAGGNLSFKREVFFKVAPFDPTCKGTSTYNDSDFCIRVRKAGYKFLYNPKAVVTHLRAKRADFSRDRNKFQGRYFAGRNFTYFILKNFISDIRKVLFLFFKETYWQVLIFMKKRSWDNFWGIFANILGKIVGTLLAIRYHFWVKFRERPLFREELCE